MDLDFGVMSRVFMNTWIEPDAIVSAESYEKFGLNDRRRDTNLRVLAHINHGDMTQDAIYRRYTKHVTRYFVGHEEDIRQYFYQLCDPRTGYLSQSKFMHFFEERSPVGSPGLPALLFDIFVWNAFFPFPPIHDSSGELCIDEMAFTRAVSVLAHSHLQYLSLDNYPRVEHDGMDGSWGPYSGQFVLIRLRDTSDYIRWLFRSLAIPNDTILGYETTILVPRFFMTQQRPNMPSPEEDFEEDFGRRTAEQQVVIVEKESERTVDIQDVLSEYAPGNVPWAPEHFRGVDPLREGYKLALPLLPHHPYDLTDLHVPTAKVRTLLQMLGKNGTELMTATERLGNEGLSWEEFQDVFIRHAETIASNLSFTFNNLTRLYTW